MTTHRVTMRLDTGSIPCPGSIRDEVIKGRSMSSRWDISLFDRYFSRLSEVTYEWRDLQDLDSTALVVNLAALLPKIASDLWSEDPGTLLMVATKLVRESKSPTTDDKHDISRFVRERCVPSPGSTLAASVFYEAYAPWYRQQHPGSEPIHSREFSTPFYEISCHNSACKKVNHSGRVRLKGLKPKAA